MDEKCRFSIDNMCPVGEVLRQVLGKLMGRHIYSCREERRVLARSGFYGESELSLDAGVWMWDNAQFYDFAEEAAEACLNLLDVSDLIPGADKVVGQIAETFFGTDEESMPPFGGSDEILQS